LELIMWKFTAAILLACCFSPVPPMLNQVGTSKGRKN